MDPKKVTGNRQHTTHYHTKHWNAKQAQMTILGS